VAQKGLKRLARVKIVLSYGTDAHGRGRKGIDKREVNDIPVLLRGLYKGAGVLPVEVDLGSIIERAGEGTKFPAQQLRHVGVELDCIHLPSAVPQR
jgi:hypothetical protein